MDMLLVRVNDRYFVAQSPDHGSADVQDRYGEKSHRNQQSSESGNLGYAADQGENSQTETQKQAARVSHEYLRRRKVEHKKSKDRPEQGEAEHRGDGGSLDQGDDAHGKGGKGADPAGQTVHSVDQVDGIADSHDPQHGYGVGEQS